MIVILKPFLIFAITAFLLSTLQWICIHFLNYFCYDFSFLGIIKNMFTIGSPICNAINNIQLKLVDNYIILWVSSITLFTSFITNLVQYTK